MNLMKSIGLIITLLVSLSACEEPPSAFDPVTMDPEITDPDHRPTVVELSFDSHGANLNGHLYIANGAGPHPTIILLHGFPGNEKNLDLAQSLRRAGYNVLFFHYRGAWGSEGDYSFQNVVDDVGSALTLMRSEKAQAKYRVDPNRLILVGHSVGGFAALMGAARDPAISCVAAIAPANLGLYGAIFEDPEVAGSFADYVDGAGPIAGMSGAAAVNEVITNADAFDLRMLASQLNGKSVLLLAGDKDTDVPPDPFHHSLVAAYEVEPGIELRHRVFDADHSFSWARIALTREVLDWLDSSCL
ncbi:MAG: alpha/beta fold hydrolase [Gammaproteobacteria bacterium]|nr:alpha/beta fold hydrolase [Gammaproteobacteria bacterium]